MGALPQQNKEGLSLTEHGTEELDLLGIPNQSKLVPVIQPGQENKDYGQTNTDLD